MSDISIIVVNWNTRDLLRACLKSIDKNKGFLDVQTIVVDNNSEDNSQDMVKQEFPQVFLIENKENVGFAKANNQAIPLCTSDNIMLLNSDAEILDDALQILSSYLNRHALVGAIGPKVIHPSMRLQVLSCGNQPTIRTMFNQYFFVSRIFPRWQLFEGINLLMGIHDDGPRSVEWLSGVCFLVRKSVINSVGAMSTDWFMYAEDLEWSLRIKSAGWELHHVPEAEVDHHFGASTSKNNSVKTMWVPNMLDYYKKTQNPNGLQIWIFNSVFFVGLSTRALMYKIRSILDVKNKAMWSEEVRKFRAYSKAAFENF
ncbi:MAG: glycosyltransferase family 2 protein [Chloroflexota bacterium]